MIAQLALNGEKRYKSVKGEDATYRIVRLFRDGPESSETRPETGLTLTEAQEHCRREDTHGNGWFDGYEEE